MPRHNRNHKIGKDTLNNNYHHEKNEPESVDVVPVRRGTQQREVTNGMVHCCAPTGCNVNDELIDSHQPTGSVKVFCNNENCHEGTWMHRTCFDEWEESVLAYLRSCGRARSWSERQRLQNLWTKKGYDLAFKACDCKCGRGHLRKDLDYVDTPAVDNVKKQKKKKKNDKPMPVMTTGKMSTNTNSNSNTTNINHINNSSLNNFNHHSQNISINNNNNGANTPQNTPPQNNINANNNGHPHLRLRTNSMGSTGSSPPNSTSSESPTPLSPLNNGNVYFKSQPSPQQAKPKFDYFTDMLTANTGNIFRRRHDFSAFNVLPRQKQNPYHIKMEDEGPHGNDDTRSFILTLLSSCKVNSLKCVLCKCELPVFDRYPLVDGTFFLSPQAYDECVVQAISDGRLQFINAVCVNCLEGGTDVRCAACKQKWNGSTFLLGSMYAYDIFASMPCCQKRLTCKHCRRAVVDVTTGLPYYSEYSHMIACPYCKAHDYHFIRPLSETFITKQSIWK